MIWKNYSHLEGTHAFLSPSRYHWLNYSPERLVEAYKNHMRVGLGTRYHTLAAELIRLAVRLPNTAAPINSFVNDAIGFRMTPEVLLYYSMRCYGMADAISYSSGILRIHDLKTGSDSGSISQLLIYAGLFCLDYGINITKDLSQTCLRIYHTEVIEYMPTNKDMVDIVSKIIEADRIIKLTDESIM